MLATLPSVWERKLQKLPVFIALISAKLGSRYMFALPVD